MAVLELAFKEVCLPHKEVCLTESYRRHTKLILNFDLKKRRKFQKSQDVLEALSGDYILIVSFSKRAVQI